MPVCLHHRERSHGFGLSAACREAPHLFSLRLGLLFRAADVTGLSLFCQSAGGNEVFTANQAKLPWGAF
jgi:hypothetical protein